MLCPDGGTANVVYIQRWTILCKRQSCVQTERWTMCTGIETDNAVYRNSVKRQTILFTERESDNVVYKWRDRQSCVQTEKWTMLCTNIEADNAVYRRRDRQTMLCTDCKTNNVV